MTPKRYSQRYNAFCCGKARVCETMIWKKDKGETDLETVGRIIQWITA
jgi:hypothetical protein